MPIRPDAAKKLAQDLLDPYIAWGICPPEVVANAASIIERAVEIDELDREREILETSIAVRKLIKGCGA